jgi:chromosome segregation ATPase
MDDIVRYLPQAAGGGTLMVLGYGLKMFLEWIEKLRSGRLEEKKLEIHEESAQVTDAAAANAIMLDTLRAVREENARLGNKVDTLETRNAEKDVKIDNLQKQVGELRAQVNALLQKLDGVDFELDDLRDKP